MDDKFAATTVQRWAATRARLPSILLLLTILFGLIGYYSQRTWVTERYQHLVSLEATREAHRQVETVEQALDELHSRVDLAISELPLIISSGEALDTRRWETALAELLPDARHVLIMVPDDLRFEMNRWFVAQVLARSLLSDEDAPPRIVREQGEWLVAIPSLLRGNHPAAVIVYLPIDGLAPSVAPSQGEVRLEQHLPGSGRQVVHQSGASTSARPIRLPLSPPHWQLTFTPGAHLVDQVSVLPGRLLSGLFVLLTIAALAGGLALKARDWIRHKRQKNAEALTRQQQEQEHYHQALSLLDQLHHSLIPNTAEQSPNDAALSSEHAALFREYDIRGHARHFTERFVTDIGRAIASETLEHGDTAITVGQDSRLSSPRLFQALTNGILDAGCDVIDLGVVPTPAMNFAAATLPNTRSGVMITASHNPPGDNGCKIVIAGEPLSGTRIQSLRQRVQEQNFLTGTGTMMVLDIREPYLERATADITSTPLKVVLDCANGAAGPLAVELLTRIGCNVIPLYCDPDGNFPNHSPDPTQEENLSDLKLTVQAQQASLGIALDGDGDRMLAVTAGGRVVWPDELMMLFARDILTRHPGAHIVYDVKSTWRLPKLIRAYGGEPVVSRTGHSYLRRAVAEQAAPLGGEYSGHLFFPDRWFGFDDGLYAAARLIELLGLREQTLDDIVATLPSSVASPEVHIPVAETDKFALIDRLKESSRSVAAEIDHTDGLRIQWPHGWGLVRASNTSAKLTLRFEANSEHDLEDIKSRFRTLLADLALPSTIPF